MMYLLPSRAGVQPASSGVRNHNEGHSTMSSWYDASSGVSLPFTIWAVILKKCRIRHLTPWKIKLVAKVVGEIDVMLGPRVPHTVLVCVQIAISSHIVAVVCLIDCLRLTRIKKEQKVFDKSPHTANYKL